MLFVPSTVLKLTLGSLPNFSVVIDVIECVPLVGSVIVIITVSVALYAIKPLHEGCHVLDVVGVLRCGIRVLEQVAREDLAVMPNGESSARAGVGCIVQFAFCPVLNHAFDDAGVEQGTVGGYPDDEVRLQVSRRHNIPAQDMVLRAGDIFDAVGKCLCLEDVPQDMIILR